MPDTPIFTDTFGRFVCDGESIRAESEGFTLVATVYHDDNTTPPWKREDGHGPVSEWEQREPEEGERLLVQERGGSRRFYDFAEAVRIAKRDGWRVHPEHSTDDPDAIAVEAAEADFKGLKAWCDDEWHYVGVAVVVSKNGVELTGQYDHALWGIEANYPNSDNAYLAEVANELAPQALESARFTLAALCACPSLSPATLEG